MQDLRESDIDKQALYNDLAHSIKRENSGELVNVDVSKIKDSVTQTINKTQTITKIINAKIHVLTMLNTNIKDNIGGAVINVSNSAVIRAVNETTTNQLLNAVEDFASKNGITATDDSKTSGLGDNVEKTVGKVVDDVDDAIKGVGGELIAIIMSPIIFVIIIAACVAAGESKNNVAAAAPAVPPTPSVNFALVEAT